MKKQKQSIQISSLLDDNTPYIKCDVNNSNIVHKKSVTPIIHNNTICTQILKSNRFIRNRLRYIMKGTRTIHNHNRIHIMASQA